MADGPYAEKKVYRVIIKAPIETVWSELVKQTSPRPFFWNSSWDAAKVSPGEPFRMLSADKRAVGVVGEFLEMKPPHFLSHTFRLTSLDDPPSKVTYTLKETQEGVEFCLITENIVAGSKSVKSMDGGAKSIVENFKAYVETGRSTFSGQMMNAMMRLMGGMVPKALRAENWPLVRR
ncbi:MAG: SRPBCC domain-containing protein [Parvularculaceae bacterium]|nr:SRPBCC domain-containing protein [Parvularculaceae bacterium]